MVPEKVNKIWLHSHEKPSHKVYFSTGGEHNSIIPSREGA